MMSVDVKIPETSVSVWVSEAPYYIYLSEYFLKQRLRRGGAADIAACASPDDGRLT